MMNKLIDKTISHYKILEKLGGGGMGIVYKAQDLMLDRFVALKFLPLYFSADEAKKKRFIQEAKAASALDHPNICTIHEINETEDGQMFIAMAYYEGETLKKKIEHGPIPVNEAIDIALQITEGLKKAHSQAIVHRDIKPANIMIPNDGTVKIVDFGLAKMADIQMTRSDATMGTLTYASPEQLRGQVVDHRTDIWSLGVVLYEMLTGQLPFSGETEEAMFYSILNDVPEQISDLRSEIPWELEKIVGKTIEKSSSDRYQHVDEILVDLRTLKKKLEIGTMKQQPIPIFYLPGKRAYIYGGIAGLIALTLFALYIFFSSTPHTPYRKSIAVLPFENMNKDKEGEYFSTGISEDILTQLSKIGDLTVISRASAMQYKNSDKSLYEIGDELKVETILRGSVRRLEEQVRIACHLIDVQTNRLLWSETYDRKADNIFTIQSDVAQQIAKTLKAKLSPIEKERIEKKPTENLTAYDYYLKGRNYYYRYRKQDNENAIQLFKKALELDTQYALAWAGLGDAYAQRSGTFGFEFSWLDSGIVVSKKAIILDPNSAEAYKALGIAYGYKGWNDKALEAFRKAVDCNPNYLPAVGNIGLIYFSFGALDEALRWQKKTVVLMPTNAGAYSNVGDSYRFLNVFGEAEQWFNKALELQPDFVNAYIGLARTYLAQMKDQQAIDQIEKLLSIDSDDARILEKVGEILRYTDNFSEANRYYRQSMAANTSIGMDPYTNSPIGLGHILWKTGQQDEAQMLFNRCYNLRQKEIDQGSKRADIRYEIAAIQAIQGNKTEAYTWLQKAIDVGWRDYLLGLRDPWLENLHDDKRFKQMMGNVKAMIDKMRKQVANKG